MLPRKSLFANFCAVRLKILRPSPSIWQSLGRAGRSLEKAILLRRGRHWSGFHVGNLGERSGSQASSQESWR